VKDAFGVEISKSKKAIATGVGVSVVGSVIANQLPQNSKGRWKVKNKPISKVYLGAGKYKALSELSSRQLDHHAFRLKTGAVPVKSRGDQIFDAMRTHKGQGKRRQQTGFGTAISNQVKDQKAVNDGPTVASKVKNVRFPADADKSTTRRIERTLKGSKIKKPTTYSTEFDSMTGSTRSAPKTSPVVNIDPDAGSAKVIRHETAHLAAVHRKPHRVIRDATSPRPGKKLAGEEARADAAMGGRVGGYPHFFKEASGGSNYTKVYRKITGRDPVPAKGPNHLESQMAAVQGAGQKLQNQTIANTLGNQNTWAERIKAGKRKKPRPLKNI
jgi:hypothetical protein